jgi:hypothetical protein
MGEVNFAAAEYGSYFVLISIFVFSTDVPK